MTSWWRFPTIKIFKLSGCIAAHIICPDVYASHSVQQGQGRLPLTPAAADYGVEGYDIGLDAAFHTSLIEFGCMWPESKFSQASQRHGDCDWIWLQRFMCHLAVQSARLLPQTQL